MKVLALILAGGQGTRLGVITNNLAKPAVPFGGKYRIIDFAISNCVNSGINTVGVVTQYMPHQLVDHLGIGKPWDLDIKDGGLYVLPPYLSRSDTSWYEGTADAVYQNIEFIDKYKPDFVIILSGDHVYRMDYNDIIDYHIEKSADCTIACMEVPVSEANRFGIMVTDPFNKIREFQEKPKEPKGTLASLGIYVFSWDFLKKALMKDASSTESDHDFGKNIIPSILKNNSNLYAYNFEGYWRDVGTISSYLDCNLEILGPLPPLDLHDKNWKVYTQSEELPPAFISDKANVIKSFVSEGAEIYGEVENSVIFQGVIVEKGAKIKDSVIMNRVKVGKETIINKSIIASSTVVGDKCEIGLKEYKVSKINKEIYNSDITLIGFNTNIPDKTIIGKNCVIDNFVDLKELNIKNLNSGEGIINEF
ncbi:glucose-1-phosphate adenylyltransferase [Oceanotoga teriensis]|uniref:Glucose-1-phosphate adenylyltransferase n=1 Tax=Oceanotoga teriensis TaxID=515440 RepID=A0AA45HK50_9BACT|nr:glucose-1-phosphate adenylyltransferase [Oceanotoga teriensis]MDO7975373.1 glucose-1-phosphate adenylyltransferase [Oceanotoga teriensis]PWJ96705.1 glucose-1-phosphate adenylyltransferase [Oceanotoga teriensis]